jgi:hypothetical protein
LVTVGAGPVVVVVVVSVKKIVVKAVTASVTVVGTTIVVVVAMNELQYAETSGLSFFRSFLNSFSQSAGS